MISVVASARLGTWRHDLTIRRFSDSYVASVAMRVPRAAVDSDAIVQKSDYYDCSKCSAFVSRSRGKLVPRKLAGFGTHHAFVCKKH